MDGESKRSHNRLGVILQNQPSELESLPLDYLREITNNFCDEHLLGKGGFGIVYKGVKQNGDMIAVKKLALTEPGSQDRQFEKEVRHLMGLKHPNIVQLVGYCVETQFIPLLYEGKYICAEKSERFICLEYLPKGSLHEHLSDEKSGLDWDTRYRIIQGICYGLHYLHEEWNVNTPIIHMDLKPPNILLDDNLVPKISDFGLSRLFGEEQTRICTASRDGTLGYMAPEYINRGVITKKLDIFSLGVIIIEIMTGRKDYPYETETSRKFIKLVLENWRNRLKNSSRYAFLETDYQQIRRCIEIGLACVKVDLEERPTTCEIIKLLHGLEGAEYNNERLLLDMRVIAELRQGDLVHTASIVTSIEFDRDEELFATAGVSKCIKVFEFSSVVNEPSDVHCPVVEMATTSKLSCLSWNKYSKNVIASSDYEGIVTVWDVQTRQSVMKYEEHEKRAWSVDFSRTEPSMLVSGSDDCKVKVWCTKQEASVINIDMEANICAVQYNPGSSYYVAVGSADHHIHYFDLRNPSAPLHVFGGHKKAVSYVKFLSNNELASASTDSTLRLWDVKENCPVRTFRGHKNKRNFVGLSGNNEYIACGSETNEVFVYHKAISIPAVSLDLDDADDDLGSSFISAVCWKSDSPTMLTGNSKGTIKVLVLAP